MSYVNSVRRPTPRWEMSRSRLLTQNHRPYAAIQQADGADEIRDALASAAQALADSLSESSLDEIESAINGRAARYGPDELSTALRLSEQIFHADADDFGDDDL